MKCSRFIRWALLCAVFAIIAAGCVILMITPHYDHDHPFLTLGGLVMAALCMLLGVWLGHYLDKRKLLPE